MLPKPKRQEIGSKTSDCLFIGYAQHSVAYRFLVLKSDVLDCNTIIETKNAKFFEHIFSSNKVSHTPKASSIFLKLMKLLEEVKEWEKK